MIKLYLITGFLGSGKTTFLKNFVSLFDNERIALIINEFGKEGIDGELLSPLNIDISEINNGSIFCACRLEQFEQTLKEIIKKEPKAIIIEASGLSDPTSIRNILSDKEYDRIQYMGSICLVDAVNLKKVYSTARVCKKQIAISDVAIINKTDLASQEDIENTRNILLMQKPDIQIFETAFGRIKPEWIKNMTVLEYKSESNAIKTQDITLQKYLITVKDNFTYERLKKFIQMFIEDTYRIKGFVSIDGEIYFVDCVSNTIKIEKYNATVDSNRMGKIVVLSGKGMPTRRSISEAIKWYADEVECVQ